MFSDGFMDQNVKLKNFESVSGVVTYIMIKIGLL